MQYPLVSLVIPCYNEKDRVDRMFHELDIFLKAWQSRVEILIVDDGSTDGTSDAICKHKQFKPDCMQLIQQANTGKGGALKLGVQRASGEFILTLDADMATSPMELFEWLSLKKQFSKNELWIGSREINKTIVHDKKYREFIGHVFNAVIRWLSKLNIKDTQCGFKLYPAHVGKELFNELKTLGWAHDVEILVSARKKKIPVIEMPVRWEAVDGSKIRIVQDSWNMFWEVVRIGR